MSIKKETDEISLKSLIDAVDDGVTVIDKNFNVIFQNKSIENKFGEIIG